MDLIIMYEFYRDMSTFYDAAVIQREQAVVQSFSVGIIETCSVWMRRSRRRPSAYLQMSGFAPLERSTFV